METIIAAIIGLITGAVSGLISARAGRKKSDAEAAHAITEAATALLEPLTNRVASMEQELQQLRPLPEIVRRLRVGINRLIEQIRCLGHEPVWVPEHDEQSVKETR